MEQSLAGIAVVCLAATVAACAPTAEEKPAVEEAATTEADVEAINGVREAWVGAPPSGLESPAGMDPARTLVFYLLESEQAPIGPDTKRYAAQTLPGYHADFWADIEPYLTVLAVDDFISEARRVESELSTEAALSELDRIRDWVRTGGLPVVGYQLEETTAASS